MDAVELVSKIDRLSLNRQGHRKHIFQQPLFRYITLQNLGVHDLQTELTFRGYQPKTRKIPDMHFLVLVTFHQHCLYHAILM